MRKEQARHVYKKVESDGIVKVASKDKLIKGNTDDEVNPYQKIVIHIVYKDNYQYITNETVMYA